MSPNAARLRILGTSDIHMRLLGFDYFADCDAPGTGTSALMQTLSHLRGETDRDTLLFDNGDLIQGTPLADTFARTPNFRKDLVKALENMGYAAFGIGNHDLDYGLDHLSDIARGLTAPMLSANMHFREPQDWLKPFTLLSAGPLTVGVVSVLPPRTMDWAHAQLDGQLTISNMVTATRTTAQTARDSGADIIVALAHTGLGYDPLENGLSAIAQDGAIDVLIGGHTHQTFPDPAHASLPGADLEKGTLHGIPTVMCGFGAAQIGAIDLDLTQNDAGPWCITKACVAVHNGAKQAPVCTPELTPLLAAHQATRDRLDTCVGTSRFALNSYFAHLAPPTMLAVIADAQRAAIETARTGTPYETLPLLSAASPSRAGGRGGPANYSDVAAGEIKTRHLIDLDLFANQVWAVEMTGAEIQDWLEMAAGAFHQACPTAPTELLNRDFPPFYFDLLCGLTYAIDPTQPARFNVTGDRVAPDASRISDICFEGKQVAPDQTFLVALTNYRACGGGNFPGMHPKRPVLRTTLDTADILQRYIQSGREPRGQRPWRFAQAARGVLCHYETGPGALAHLDTIKHLSPGTPVHKASGFVSIPVTL